MSCSKCGGTGKEPIKVDNKWEYRTCVCKTVPSIDETQKNKEKRIISKEWLQNHIPNKYFQNETFNISILEADISRRNILIGKDFLQYKLTLQGLIEYVKIGKLPSNSFYIYAPKYFGKKIFAYTYMKEAYQNGFNPSPIYSLTTLCAYRSQYKRDLLNKIFEEQDIDILFVSSGNHFLLDEIFMLKYLLDECELRGIVLILLSKHPAEHIYKLDPSFEYIISPKITRLGAYSSLQYVSVTTAKDLHGINKGGIK